MRSSFFVIKHKDDYLSYVSFGAGMERSVKFSCEPVDAIHFYTYDSALFVLGAMHAFYFNASACHIQTVIL